MSKKEGSEKDYVVMEEDEDGDWVLADEDETSVDELINAMDKANSEEPKLSPMQSKIIESWKDYP